MKRSSLLSLGALVLVASVAMTGAVLAQDPPPAGDPDPMMQSATGEPGSQPSNPTYDPNRPSADPYRPADPATPSAADPDRAGDTNDPTRRNLPATASNAPVLLLIGAVALGTLAAFLVLRRRGVTNT
ncbi:MAG TPA: LPXTG cell wall anchor domain-containing protein [Candidatus Polarisedimenticolia bacterium]|nr:LPXTG cell wall anchor domain-containing protein [Candidatus Polarisedimenticolia bacterium]